MRLIDADAFEKFIKEKYKDGESTDDIKDQVLFDLSYQPTAYDPEKVVAELEEQKVRYKNIRNNTHCIITETSECDSCRADHYLDARLNCVDKAIEIVRKGGAE